MKVLCGISGVEFNCEHFPGFLSSREMNHPVFLLPQKKLLAYTAKWAAQELTPIDSYLLFLSILNSSNLVEFRVSVSRSPMTDSIIAQNMESLLRTVIRLNTVTNPAVTFPRFAITTETKYLTNIKHWIEAWAEAYKDFQDGYRKQEDSRKLINREAALERMIKNPHLPISAYASKIAEWASIAGDFPQYNTKSPFTNLNVKMGDYWKEIIMRCTREESIFSVPQVDIEDLLEHCEENIPIGTIYSNALFTVLRKAIERQKNFLDLGDFDLSPSGSNYKILQSSDTVEAANLKALIDSAPTEQPTPEKYPNRFSFIRAKLRWEMAKKYGTGKDGE